MKTLYMESTTIPPERTAGEITVQLIRGGATQISTQYDAGKIIGLRWSMPVNGMDVAFEMPVRTEPIYKILVKRHRSTWISDKQKRVIREKAERVAWRQLLRWVESQMAMLETGMVQPAEVFLAYAISSSNGRTLFENMMETQFKALPAPAPKV